MKRPYGVVGAGSWGTTLCKILSDHGHEVFMWAHDADVVEEINRSHTNERYLPDAKLPPTVRASGEVAEVCEACHLLLMVVPSHVFRSVAGRMGEYVNGEQVIVHCTKGIEQGSHLRMSQILREETCVRKIGVLSGPNLARELAARRPAGTLVASKYAEVVALAQEALHGPYFRVYGGDDVAGAEVGGAFKNIIAVAAGLVDGLGLGDNTRALLLTRGLVEMARYGEAMKARVLTFFGMAGIGDLMATCASPLSRNHQVGERLARGESLKQIQEGMFMVAEGVKTARAVHQYALEHGMELPIVEAVYGMLYHGLGVDEAMGALMGRGTGDEFKDLTQGS